MTMTKGQVQLVEYYFDEIEEWIESTDFQFDFFIDLQAYYERNETLSPKQIASLERIYKRVTEAGCDA